MKKCEHIIGLIALGERVEVNDELRHSYVMIPFNSDNPDDMPDGDYDVAFDYCPFCGKQMIDRNEIEQVKTKVLKKIEKLKRGESLPTSVGDNLPDVALPLSKQGNEGAARATLPARSVATATDLLARTQETFELENIRDSDDKFVILLKCKDCGSELNRSREISGKEISRCWASIVMGSPLNAGKCKNGCPSTFSDCNMNTSLIIIRANAL